MKILKLKPVLAALIFALALLGMHGCGQKASGDETSTPPESLYSEESSSDESIQETSLDQTEEISEDTEQSDDEYVSFPYETKASIRSDMPEFTFTVDGYTEEYASIVTGLNVKDEDGNILLNISFQENGDSMSSDQNNLDRPEHPRVVSIPLMELEDINFDDTLDITVNFLDYRNASYYGWIWDDTENAYRYESGYVMIGNPLLNPEHKMILSQSVSGAAHHTYAVCQYIDGILIETNRITDINIPHEEIDPNVHDMHLTEEKLVDGEWVTVVDTTYNSKNRQPFGALWLNPPWNSFDIINPATGMFQG